MADKQSREGWWKLGQVIASFLLTATAATVAYAVNNLHNLDVRVSKVEQTVLTNQDGLAIWKEIALIREEQARLPKESPPAWFVSQVQQMEARINTRLERIEKQLDSR